MGCAPGWSARRAKLPRRGPRPSARQAGERWVAPALPADGPLLRDADRLEHPELDVLAMVLRAHEAREPRRELLRLAVLPRLARRVLGERVQRLAVDGHLPAGLYREQVVT